jgi:hypothetical protein
MTLEMLLSPVKDEDEFNYFRQVIITAKQTDEVGLRGIVARLTDAKQKYLRHVLNNQRVVVNPREKKTEARRIVTVKSRKAAPILQ